IGIWLSYRRFTLAAPTPAYYDAISDVLTSYCVFRRIVSTQTSVVTSKPAIHGHFKTGHRRVAGTRGFYAFSSILSTRF
ncbi:MAG: hypothetical protein ACRD8U_06575, partial [Pyrinomonadaceae bacterium]